MTFVAVLPLGEREARSVATALAQDGWLDAAAIDVSELAPGRWEVAVHFDQEPTQAERRTLAEALSRVLGGPAPAFAVTELAATNWVARSLAGLKPVRAGRFLVHGSHDRHVVRPNDIAIEIEAGEAFGTGHHGSTRGCLLAIDAIGRRRAVRSALDVGTGSGVLAIAVARGLHAPVLASDIDPTATRIAAANARLNRAGTMIRAVNAAGLSPAVIRDAGPFDLILANILAGPLVKLAPAVRRRLAPQGEVVLSGILPAQRARVIAAYRGQGLRLARAAMLDGWVTLLLARKPVKKAGMRTRPLRALPAGGRRSPARHRRAR
jgi:ribosomal protein L11 methyltransferase